MPTGTPDRESEDSEDNDFEIIPSPVKENSRILALLNGLGQVPREKGLDEQNFECAGCKCAIGKLCHHRSATCRKSKTVLPQRTVVA